MRIAVRSSASSTSPSLQTRPDRAPPGAGTASVPIDAKPEAYAQILAPARTLRAGEAASHRERRRRLRRPRQVQDQRAEYRQRRHVGGGRVARRPMNGVPATCPSATGRPGLIARRQKVSAPEASTAART